MFHDFSSLVRRGKGHITNKKAGLLLGQIDMVISCQIHLLTNVAESLPTFCRQTENLPAFGAWRVLIPSPVDDSQKVECGTLDTVTLNSCDNYPPSYN